MSSVRVAIAFSMPIKISYWPAGTLPIHSTKGEISAAVRVGEPLKSLCPAKELCSIRLKRLFMLTAPGILTKCSFKKLSTVVV